MKLSGITLAILAVSDLRHEMFGHAFQHASILSNSRLSKSMAPSEIHSHQSQQEGPEYIIKNEEPVVPVSNVLNKNEFGRQVRQMCAGAIAATAISFAVAITDPSQISSTVANAADLSLSKGAIVIELGATTSDDGSTTKSQFKKFDASQEQKLLQTLLKNRKELGASIGRIQKSIQNELIAKGTNTGPTAAPIWTEIYQELMSIEGDVVPKVQITPPADIASTVKDLRNGKLNLLVNGEVINVSVEPNFGKDEDDLIIRIQGYKGGMVPKATKDSPPSSAYYGPIRSWFAQFDQFWSFWNSPTALFGAEGPAFLSGISNGEVFISGTISAIVLSYVVAYSYYIQQNEAEAIEAASKQAALAEKAKQKRKQAAMVEKAKQKKEEDAQAAAEKTAIAEKTKLKKAAITESSEDPEQSSLTPTTTAATSKRRHRIRFWKNR